MIYSPVASASTNSASTGTSGVTGTGGTSTGGGTGDPGGGGDPGTGTPPPPLPNIRIGGAVYATNNNPHEVDFSDSTSGAIADFVAILRWSANGTYEPAQDPNIGCRIIGVGGGSNPHQDAFSFNATIPADPNRPDLIVVAESPSQKVSGGNRFVNIPRDRAGPRAVGPLPTGHPPRGAAGWNRPYGSCKCRGCSTRGTKRFRRDDRGFAQTADPRPRLCRDQRRSLRPSSPPRRLDGVQHPLRAAGDAELIQQTRHPRQRQFRIRKYLPADP